MECPDCNQKLEKIGGKVGMHDLMGKYRLSQKMKSRIFMC